MKTLSSTITLLGRNIFLPAIIIFGLTFSSCKKDNSMGKPIAEPTLDANAKSLKLKNSTAKVLKDFVITFNANQQSGSGGGSNNYSNVATNYTTYSTAGGTVYSWSDPTSGTSYTLSQSNSSSGGGLGQISYNGHSFDYGYVLSIKASANDPQWTGFFNGRDLRGAIAIDGQLTATDFTLKNIAIFLVMTTGGSGTYKFLDWSSNNIGTGDGIGELLDFSAVTNNTTAGMSAAKAYITSDGHITVSDQSFDLNSDAKVTDVATNAQYSISGSLMFL
jgi:hypothetical protein